MEKRYQVFVSSTFADLKEEREEIMRALMKMDCIPAGMELFPAADEEQMQFIKKIIDDSDYYLLLIGGRYGSVSEDGVSYTEQEYEYARSKGLKVIALLHKNPENLPVSKSEKSLDGTERLNKFRQNVATGRLVQFWERADQLPGLVALSLMQTMKTYPAVGWVRGNTVASEALLSQINDLRQENDRLRESSSAKVIINTQSLAQLDELFTIHGAYLDSNTLKMHNYKTELSWEAIFGYLLPYIEQCEDISDIRKTLELVVKRSLQNNNQVFNVNDQVFQSIIIQLRALGLIAPLGRSGENDSTKFALTPQGESLMFELRAVRTAK